jgi:hypothetical protein
MNTYAVYFRPENFNIKADGSMDVSEMLQQALSDLKQPTTSAELLFYQFFWCLHFKLFKVATRRYCHNIYTSREL